MASSSSRTCLRKASHSELVLRHSRGRRRLTPRPRRSAALTGTASRGRNVEQAVGAGEELARWRATAAQQCVASCLRKKTEDFGNCLDGTNDAVEQYISNRTLE